MLKVAQDKNHNDNFCTFMGVQHPNWKHTKDSVVVDEEITVIVPSQTRLQMKYILFAVQFI